MHDHPTFTKSWNISAHHQHTLTGKPYPDLSLPFYGFYTDFSVIDFNCLPEKGELNEPLMKKKQESLDYLEGTTE